MLVLSRKVGEKVIIGDNITITVVEVNGNRVRLGISAPNDVRVLRSELVGVWHSHADAEVAADPACGEELACVPAITTTNTYSATAAPRTSGRSELRHLLSARRRKG